ncbi:MAG: hypothetical protein IPN29_20470 [Saprospiraceae bacterium]|nr:hypothetical protein [Saprospiraceae bacterium]
MNSFQKIKPVAILLVIFMLLTLIIRPVQTNNSSREPKNENTKRVSITFILGQDEKITNEFYQNATYYFQMSAKDKTDFIVHNCKSLKAVQAYIQRELTGKKFKTINLVCHGNPWQGLRIPIGDGLPRASATHLEVAFQNGYISPLCSSKIDEATTINIVSCGVGQNKLFLEMMKNIFTCPSSNLSPTVNAEAFYVNFSNKQEYVRSSLYYVTSKYDQKDNGVFISKLKRKYNNEGIDWKKAYRPSAKKCEGVPYRYHYKMLIEWSVSFKPQDKIPDLSTEKKIITWLNAQDYAKKELDQMQLKPEEIQWHCFVGPPSSKSIKIKGYCNIEGVMVDHTNTPPSSDLTTL